MYGRFTYTDSNRDTDTNIFCCLVFLITQILPPPFAAPPVVSWNVPLNAAVVANVSWQKHGNNKHELEHALTYVSEQVSSRPFTAGSEFTPNAGHFFKQSSPKKCKQFRFRNYLPRCVFAEFQVQNMCSSWRTNAWLDLLCICTIGLTWICLLN